MSFYQSPLFVDIVLMGIYALIAAAIGLTAWSMVRSLRMRRAAAADGHDDVMARRTAWGVAALLVATLVLTCLTASTQPLSINGRPFTDALWLRISDTLLNSSLVLMLVAVAGVLFGMSGLSRRRQ